ncbi:MAG: mechanosensitive ion channel family protein [Deltaproteobacteria bacterium]|nr:mechanosensitive ion channel family protein [Deltaproteobacteria bacterium]
MDFHGFLKRVIEWFITSGLHVLVILILVGIAVKVSRLVSNRLVLFFTKQREDEEFHKRARTLGDVVRYIMVSAVYTIATMTILREIGINIGPILAAAGIVGLAVGFGAQSLVKDVITGFFILMEDQIRVGDVVEVAGKSGQVEKVNLRTTALRDMAGNVHYIPNGQISVVTNMTKEYSRYVFDIGVTHQENMDEVIEIIKKIDEGLRNDPEFQNDILEPIEILGVDKFSGSAVIIKARTTTRPTKQWRIGREFNRRIKQGFNERNIEIPLPRVRLYMDQDKTGQGCPQSLK